MARRKTHKRLRARYAVLGDGQTEQYYLKHLKVIKGYNYSVYPSLFNDITIETASSKIDELISGGCDLIVYFTDYDTIVSQGKQDKFNELIKKYDDTPQVLICESMPSIEFWFLLHYKKTTREYTRADEVVQELKTFINNYSKGKAFLENPAWVVDLCNGEKLEIAVKRAKSILTQRQKQHVGKHFPFTKAHVGIEKFDKRKKS